MDEEGDKEVVVNAFCHIPKYERYAFEIDKLHVDRKIRLIFN